MFLTIHASISSNNNLINTKIGKWVDENTCAIIFSFGVPLISSVALMIIGGGMMGSSSFFGLTGETLLLKAKIVLITGSSVFFLVNIIDLIITCIHKCQLIGYKDRTPTTKNARDAKVENLLNELKTAREDLGSSTNSPVSEIAKFLT